LLVDHSLDGILEESERGVVAQLSKASNEVGDFLEGADSGACGGDIEDFVGVEFLSVVKIEC